MARKKSTLPRRTLASIQQHLEEQRRRLLGADAVVICLQRAIDSQSGRPDELRVMDALQVVSEIINNAVAALERVGKAPSFQLCDGSSCCRQQ